MLVESVDGLLAAPEQTDLAGHAGAAEESLPLQLHTPLAEALAAECDEMGLLIHLVHLPYVAVVVGLGVAGREVQASTVAGSGEDDLGTVAALHLLLQELDQAHPERLEDLVSLRARALLDHGPLHAVLQPRTADHLVREDLRVEEEQLDLVAHADELVEAAELARDLRTASIFGSTGSHDVAFCSIVRSRATSSLA